MWIIQNLLIAAIGMYCVHTLEHGCVLSFEKYLQAKLSGHTGNYLTQCTKAGVTTIIFWKPSSFLTLWLNSEATGTLSNAQKKWQLIPTASTALTKIQSKRFPSQPELPALSSQHLLSSREGRYDSIHVSSYN